MGWRRLLGRPGGPTPQEGERRPATLSSEVDAALAALASGGPAVPAEERVTAIESLVALRDSGVLTEDEFEAEKRRLADDG